MKQPDTSTRYFLVDSRALPDVFLRVAHARELLDTGEVATVAEAAARAGLSRSAYYKYRDVVMPFRDLHRGRIVTFQLLLRDRTGVLSSILTLFAELQANILTINQSIPTNGAAPVTISADTAGMTVSTEELLQRVREADGVLKAAVLAA